MKKTIVLVVVLVLLLYLSSCVLKNDLEDFFQDFKSEIEYDIAFYVDQDQIYINKQLIDMRPSLNKYFGKEVDMTEKIFCVEGRLVYGLLNHTVDNSNEHFRREWMLFTFDTVSKEIKILFEYKYYPQDMGHVELKYYYENGIIVVNDNQRTVRYDIKQKTHSVLSNDSFETQAQGAYSYKYISPQEIEIIKADTSRTITVDYMAARNEYVQKIKNLSDGKNYVLSRHPETSFFQDVFLVDDEIIILCTVLDKDGEATSLFFLYDYEADDFYFLYWNFHNYGSIPSWRDLCPVPVLKGN